MLDIIVRWCMIVFFSFIIIVQILKMIGLAWGPKFVVSLGLTKTPSKFQLFLYYLLLVLVSLYLIKNWLEKLQ